MLLSLGVELYERFISTQRYIEDTEKASQFITQHGR